MSQSRVSLAIYWLWVGNRGFWLFPERPFWHATGRPHVWVAVHVEVDTLRKLRNISSEGPLLVVHTSLMRVAASSNSVGRVDHCVESVDGDELRKDSLNASISRSMSTRFIYYVHCKVGLEPPGAWTFINVPYDLVTPGTTRRGLDRDIESNQPRYI